jgi:hypothetical protein
VFSWNDLIKLVDEIENRSRKYQSLIQRKSKGCGALAVRND